MEKSELVMVGSSPVKSATSVDALGDIDAVGEKKKEKTFFLALPLARTHALRVCECSVCGMAQAVCVMRVARIFVCM